MTEIEEPDVHVEFQSVSTPPGKLADAEVYFVGAPLEGLKLVGFSVWQRTGGARNVVFPSRSYKSKSGEDRSYNMLRPVNDGAGREGLRTLILEEYEKFIKAQK